LECRVKDYDNQRSVFRSIQYGVFGALKQLSYGNSHSLSAWYDARLRPVQWSVPGVLGYQYSYNYFNENSGRVTFARNLWNGATQNDYHMDHSYDYDHLGRLVSAYTGTAASAHTGQGSTWGGDGTYAQGYSYDQWGNLTSRSGWGGENASYTATFDSHNRMITNPANGAAFQYDSAGNTTSDGGQNFTYDATGQQATASFYNLQMSYDGDGLRVKKTENGSTNYYVRSSVLGGQVVADLNLAGDWLHGYIYLEGRLLAYQENGRVLWIHEDPLTKAKRTTDASGNIVTQVEFDPWGGEVPSPWSQMSWLQPHRYTTYERDLNSSDEAMYRRYNRWWSRFDHPDPYDGSYSLTDPQSFNRYSYVENDPVNSTDPSGLMMNDGFCGAEYSFNACGGSAGFWGGGGSRGGGGGFGSGVAEANNFYGGLTPQFRQAFDRFWFNFQNAIYGSVSGAAAYVVDPVTREWVFAGSVVYSSESHGETTGGGSGPMYGGFNPLFHPLPWRNPSITRPWTPTPPEITPPTPPYEPPFIDKELRIGPRGVEEINQLNPDKLTPTRGRFSRAGLKIIEILIKMGNEIDGIIPPVPFNPQEIICISNPYARGCRQMDYPMN
jgi:RHS repeat-associated protein